jgi:transcription elongation factor Elf1
MKWFNSIVKSIRKYYLILNKNQKSAIDAEINAIMEISENESHEWYRTERNYQDRFDGKCPICGGNSIVNKISRVQGDGSVGGSFSLGFGSVYGSMSVDTNEVNHCSKCGNEWKKYNFTYRSATKILSSYLNDIDTYIEGKYTYPEKTYNKLKNYYAETIYTLIHSDKVYESDLYRSTIDLSISTLRKYFKSIYDEMD